MFIRLHLEHQRRNSYETHEISAIVNRPVSELPIDGHNIDIAAVRTSELQTTLASYCRVFGIATRYGLNGPGIESRWGDENSRTRPDLTWGPTHPPTQ